MAGVMAGRLTNRPSGDEYYGVELGPAYTAREGLPCEKILKVQFQILKLLTYEVAKLGLCT
jgi:hypothetical protein